MESSAGHQQVGGTHYTDMLIQPWQVGYAVAGGDGGFIKLAKYLTRVKDNPAEQFAKAEHVCKLRAETTVDKAWTIPLTYQQKVILEAFCKQHKESGTLLAILGMYLAERYLDAAKEIPLYQELVTREMDK